MNYKELRPEQLLAFLARPQMVKCMLIALAVHVVLLLATSTGFLQDAVKYRTVAVKAAKTAERKAALAKAEEARRAAALKKAEEEAKKAEEAKVKREADEKARAEEEQARHAASATMKAATEISNDRPQTATMELDLDSL